MAAIVGLVGQGSIAEVRAMLGALAHRGEQVTCWSPATNVYFGWRGRTAAKTGADFVWDCQIAADDSQEFEPALARALARGDLSGLAALAGQFSIAHWSEADRRLTLATDHLAWKTVYYCSLTERFAFASEYKAFYALADFVAAPCAQAIAEHQATWRCPSRGAFLAGVQPVPPASALELRHGRLRVRRYWHARPAAARRAPSANEALLRERLIGAVERQVRGFDRVGLTLGAGLDAPVIASILHRVAPSLTVCAYTAGTGPDDPEVAGARRLAEHFRMEHRTVYFRAEHVAQRLPGLIWLMEDCTGREETLLQSLVYAQAAGAERCVITGYGADTLLGGMPRHRLLYLAERAAVLRGPLLELFRFTQTGALPRSFVGRALARRIAPADFIAPPSVRGAGAVDVHAELDLNAYIATTLGLHTPSARFLEPLNEASGTIGRYPFYDLDVIALALEIPSRQKMSWRGGKQVLRRAFADLLPEFVLRRAKAIQRVQHDLELSDALDALAGELLTDDALARRGLIEPGYVRRLRKRERGAAFDSTRIHRLWALLSLELWARMFLDGRDAIRTLCTARPPASLAEVTQLAARLARGEPPGRVPRLAGRMAKEVA